MGSGGSRVDDGLRVHFVDTAADVSDALTALDAPVLGVDVERADADRYYRRAALIQIGVPGHCLLLDGVTLGALPDVDDFLAAGDRLVVLHALENDFEPLAAKAIRPPRVADTAVAASVLGLPTGLSALLAEVLEVELTADKEAYQRADWEERPLSDGMAAYAAGDVVHLPQLWQRLAQRLADSGRSSWYEQELAATIDRSRQDARDWTRVKGAGRLSGEQRAVLREVWQERERLAREHDIAPNRLVHDDVLRSIATEPPRTMPQLVRRSQRRRNLLRRHGEALFAAVERGQAGPPVLRESSGRRWTDRDRDLYDQLRKARSAVAEELGIDAGVLCPSKPLWRAVAGAPGDGGELCASVGLRPWQAEVLATPLWEAYVAAGGLDRPAPDGAVDGDEG
ncbi:ribonuclease D [Egicoccus halophilus]|uniref:Ribonuclease D n=1 Tax=Egicoccus halophilus TaxID=1670830 RepID=A0A8J3EV45_9ACTN|nr:HRDC domain-containing protein [Egicoccus halophilus]GGI08927.1 ribonuclease D [Egicoccus halophilus]